MTNTNTVELKNPKTGIVSVFEADENKIDTDNDDMSDEEFFEYLLEMTQNNFDDIDVDVDNEEDYYYVPSQAEKEFYEKMIAIGIDISDDFKKFISGITHDDFMTAFSMLKDGKTEKEVMEYFYS